MRFPCHRGYLALLLALGGLSPVSAASKYTMPDIDQEENTCFPTAAANLIYWFGENGYPKLLTKAADAKAAQRQLIAQILVHCNATFRFGTDFSSMTDGLSSLFKAHGYNAKISYHGIAGQPLAGLEWFDKNSRDNTGFILCMAFVQKNPGNQYLPAMGTGHAVTVMSYNQGVAVVLDPAHPDGDSGRRTLRFQPVSNAFFFNQDEKFAIPLIYELEGMPIPTGSSATTVILVGAICMEMPPLDSVPSTIGQKP